MKKVLLLVLALQAAMLSAWAEGEKHSGPGVKPLPTLHVEGKWLVDEHGNHVVLHGVMDTPSAWFNGGRWGWSYDDGGRQRCLDYFEKLFAGLEEAKCNVFRLHLEPAWTNDPTAGYVYSGSAGQSADATGEADISKFNPTRLTNYLKTLYVPLMLKALEHGLYVVVRPPGVCPHDLKVGDYYQNYLRVVWNIVTRNEDVKKHAGQISIELANEPVNLKNAAGETDPKALHDYFQPIVEKMRSNGYTGIIWVPGTGWQSNYADYAKYPVEGYNIGYAVHDYEGWYGCSDASANAQNKIRQFRQQVPVVDNYPIIITEVDWSPAKPGTGHYNEHGAWVESNYGTWATATTSRWGNAFKAVLDHYGNISMTLSGTGCLLDVDELVNHGNVTPAFGGLEEACGKACMDWYADYYQRDYPHADDEADSDDYLTAVSLTGMKDMEVQLGSYGVTDFTATFADGHRRNVTPFMTYKAEQEGIVTFNNGQVTGVGAGSTAVTAAYTDKRGGTVQTTFDVTVKHFPFGARFVRPNIVGVGRYNETSQAARPAAGGQVGWQYDTPFTLSGYKYLVIDLKQKQTCNAHLNIYTTKSGTAGYCYSSPDFGEATRIVINLKEARYNDGSAMNGRLISNSRVYTVAFWGDGNGIIVLKDMYLTNNDDYSPETTGIAAPVVAVREQPAADRYYDLQGRQVAHPAKGLYIRNGRKVAVK
jgi:hypothetical protein